MIGSTVFFLGGFSSIGGLSLGGGDSECVSGFGGGLSGMGGSWDDLDLASGASGLRPRLTAPLLLDAAPVIEGSSHGFLHPLQSH